MAGAGSEVVMAGQLQDARMEVNPLSMAVQDHTAEIVIQEDSGAAAEPLQGPHMSPQKVLQTLIEEEL